MLGSCFWWIKCVSEKLLNLCLFMRAEGHLKNDQLSQIDRVSSFYPVDAVVEDSYCYSWASKDPSCFVFLAEGRIRWFVHTACMYSVLCMYVLCMYALFSFILGFLVECWIPHTSPTLSLSPLSFRLVESSLGQTMQIFLGCIRFRVEKWLSFGSLISYLPSSLLLHFISPLFPQFGSRQMIASHLIHLHHLPSCAAHNGPYTSSLHGSKIGWTRNNLSQWEEFSVAILLQCGELRSHKLQQPGTFSLSSVGNGGSVYFPSLPLLSLPFIEEKGEGRLHWGSLGPSRPYSLFSLLIFPGISSCFHLLEMVLIFVWIFVADWLWCDCLWEVGPMDEFGQNPRKEKDGGSQEHIPRIDFPPLSNFYSLSPPTTTPAFSVCSSFKNPQFHHFHIRSFTWDAIALTRNEDLLSLPTTTTAIPLSGIPHNCFPHPKHTLRFPLTRRFARKLLDMHKIGFKGKCICIVKIEI